MAMMPSASPPAVAADAAGGDNDGVPAESLLPPDAWHHIFSLLSPKDIGAAAATCRCLSNVAREQSLWHALYVRDFVSRPATRSLCAEVLGNRHSSRQPWSQRYIEATAVFGAERAVWRQDIKKDRHSPGWFIPCEGHGLAALSPRTVVTYGAFSQFGIHTEVFAFDVDASSGACTVVHVKQRAPPEGIAPADPSSTYGHTLTPIGKGRLLRYGGCLFGGYHGATTDPIVLQFGDGADEAGSDGGGVAGAKASARGRASAESAVGAAAAAATGSLPRTTTCYAHVPPLADDGPHAFGRSSYHAAIPLPQQPSAVLFVGGLQDDAPHMRVALLDTETWSWLPVTVTNPEATPPGRYGFASAIVNNQLWVVGGCDGGDIRRDGTDLRDVHSLDLRGLSATAGGEVTWNSFPELTPPAGTFGREVCCVDWGTKILAFGGSTNHMRRDESTNAVYWFDTEFRMFGHVRMHGPESAAPFPCISTEAVRCGQYLVLAGGWTKRSLLDGPWVLDMRPTPDMLEAVEAFEPELEEFDDDDDAASGEMGAQRLQQLMYLLRNGGFRFG